MQIRMISSRKPHNGRSDISGIAFDWAYCFSGLIQKD